MTLAASAAPRSLGLAIGIAVAGKIHATTAQTIIKHLLISILPKFQTKRGAYNREEELWFRDLRNKYAARPFHTIVAFMRVAFERDETHFCR